MKLDILAFGVHPDDVELSCAGVLLIEKFIPDFKALHDTLGLLVLFLIIIILGVSITLVSTHRSVIKYLRMKLDDLY